MFYIVVVCKFSFLGVGVVQIFGFRFRILVLLFLFVFGVFVVLVCSLFGFVVVVCLVLYLGVSFFGFRRLLACSFVWICLWLILVLRIWFWCVVWLISFRCGFRGVDLCGGFEF